MTSSRRSSQLSRALCQEASPALQPRQQQQREGLLARRSLLLHRPVLQPGLLPGRGLRHRCLQVCADDAHQAPWLALRLLTCLPVRSAHICSDSTECNQACSIESRLLRMHAFAFAQHKCKQAGQSFG
jgi:hypothetical protein